MELHLGRQLKEDETVDHIDQNVQNNDISNLRVITRREHAENDAIRNKDITVNCAYCGKEFTIPGNKIPFRNRRDRNYSGYFCSKRCSGKYGAEIQHKQRNPNPPAQKVVPEKYTRHNFNK